VIETCLIHGISKAYDFRSGFDICRACEEADDLDDGPEEDEWEFDCGMGRDGLCGKAGSEECDFECPYRDAKRN
jgi:hypothetical protein